MTSLHNSWYRGDIWVWLLWPLSLLFRVITCIRKLLYRWHIFKSHKVDVPVIVVGNITVGGNGKTPVVVALAQYMTLQGLKVGLLSRGYKAKTTTFPRVVTAHDSASEVGDEPLLLAQKSEAVVIIDPIRPRGAKALVKDYGVDVIICDDGLQHYALHRDVEIVVMDERRLGSGFLLPMGPLRETAARLLTVDCIVHNTTTTPGYFKLDGVDEYSMTLTPSDLVNVLRSSVSRACVSDGKEAITAMAGIGNPQRFFELLRRNGWSLSSAVSFIDHAQYKADDIPDGMVITTEKDAVKMRNIAHSDCWYLPVSAQLPQDFYQKIRSNMTTTTRLNKE